VRVRNLLVLSFSCASNANAPSFRLSDKALLLAFGESLPSKVFDEPPMSSHVLPWKLKQKILGLRGSEWAPKSITYAKQNWGVTDPPSP
jgi:hypothetical protein